MTIIEVKKGLLDKMKTVFPESEFHYYSAAVVEAYERPCFFTRLIVIDVRPANFNTKKIQAAFYIEYRQESDDEVDNLKVIEKLEELFELSVEIKDRAVKVNNMEYDFVGQNRNIAEVTFDIEWYKDIGHLEKLPLMESADFNTDMEE